MEVELLHQIMNGLWIFPVDPSVQLRDLTILLIGTHNELSSLETIVDGFLLQEDEAVQEKGSGTLSKRVHDVRDLLKAAKASH